METYTLSKRNKRNKKCFDKKVKETWQWNNRVCRDFELWKAVSANCLLGVSKNLSYNPSICLRFGVPLKLKHSPGKKWNMDTDMDTQMHIDKHTQRNTYNWHSLCDLE